MFAVCLLLGTGARSAARLLASTWSAPAPAGLQVAVRSGARGMRLENLTPASWAGCVVTLEGGVSSEPFAFPPNGVLRLGYRSFRAGATPLAGQDGFARAFHQMSMQCRDDGGQWQTAEFR